MIVEALKKSPSTTLIYNADDPLCAAIAERVDNPLIGFGIDEPTGLEADRISDSRFCAKCNAPYSMNTFITDSSENTAAPNAAGNVRDSHLPHTTSIFPAIKMVGILGPFRGQMAFLYP